MPDCPTTSPHELRCPGRVLVIHPGDCEGSYAPFAPGATNTGSQGFCCDKYFWIPAPEEKFHEADQREFWPECHVVDRQLNSLKIACLNSQFGKKNVLSQYLLIEINPIRSAKIKLFEADRKRNDRPLAACEPFEIAGSYVWPFSAAEVIQRDHPIVGQHVLGKNEVIDDNVQPMASIDTE